MSHEDIAELVASWHREHSQRAAELDLCEHCEMRDAILEALDLASRQS